jgi:hypothetical protein
MVKRINQTMRAFKKCFESTLYLVEKNVIGNKRQMHTVLFKQSGVFVIEISGEHSKIRPAGTCLGLQQLGCQLVWVGMPGMRWENVVPLIHSLINYRGIPFAVIIHCGGNDIGLVPCGELLWKPLFTLFLVISIFLKFSEYLHFILGRILDHTRDVPGNILERIAIVNLM